MLSPFPAHSDKPRARNNESLGTRLLPNYLPTGSNRLRTRKIQINKAYEKTQTRTKQSSRNFRCCFIAIAGKTFNTFPSLFSGVIIMTGRRFYFAPRP